MSKAVFDTSAILAIYHKEPGRKKVLQLIDRHEPLISSVNFAELVAKLSEETLSLSDITESFDGLEIDIVDFTREHATATGDLRMKSRDLGLSLGDRACIALGIAENALIVTADRSWASIDDIGKVEVIR